MCFHRDVLQACADLNMVSTYMDNVFSVHMMDMMDTKPETSQSPPSGRDMSQTDNQITNQSIEST